MARSGNGDAGACAKDFGAILTRTEAEKLEIEQITEWRPRRRVALGTLQRSVDQLAALGPIELLEAIQFVAEWREHLLCSAGLAECVTARLLLAAGAKEVNHGA